MAKQIQFPRGLLWESPRRQTTPKVTPMSIENHDPQQYVTSGLESVSVCITSN